jgi:hypothetical protein
MDMVGITLSAWVLLQVRDERRFLGLMTPAQREVLAERFDTAQLLLVNAMVLALFTGLSWVRGGPQTVDPATLVWLANGTAIRAVVAATAFRRVIGRQRLWELV